MATWVSASDLDAPAPRVQHTEPAPEDEKADPLAASGNIYHGPAASVLNQGWDLDQGYMPFEPLATPQQLSSPHVAFPSAPQDVNTANPWEQWANRQDIGTANQPWGQSASSPQDAGHINNLWAQSVAQPDDDGHINNLWTQQQAQPQVGNLANPWNQLSSTHDKAETITNPWTQQQPQPLFGNLANPWDQLTIIQDDSFINSEEQPDVSASGTLRAQQSDKQSSGGFSNLWGQQAGTQSSGGFSKLWEAEAGGTTPFVQASSAGPALGNVYPGLPGRSRPLRTDYLPDSAQLPSGTLTHEVNQFIRPLPLWVNIPTFVAGTGLLLALILLNSDWATGAVFASVVAILFAILLLIANGVRVALGLLSPLNPRRRSQIIYTTILVLLLFVFSGLSLSQQSGLHAMQARYLENQHNWPTAITEFQSAGEASPTSTNLARVYDEWGETLSNQQQYPRAVTNFSTVLTTYQGATVQVQRAQKDMLAAYFAWGQHESNLQHFSNSTAHYDTLLALNYCIGTCQSQAQAADALAYYNLAVQQLNARQFTTSVNAFTVLTTRFPSTPQAKQVHNTYAQALWGLGQQQLNTTCADAVKTYQQLSHQFGDTTQGKAAAKALQQPVMVQGHFTTQIPGTPYTPTVALVQGMYAGIPPYLFSQLLDNASSAPVNSNGTFTFSSVPQGTYELVWSYDGRLHYYYAYSGTQILYKATLGPLCTYNYGAINQVIPTF